MKLGTKIILGFVMACAIFVILSTVIYLSLQSVRHGALLLDEEVMPARRNSGEIQYGIALESLHVLDYDYSNNESSWTNAQEQHRKIADMIRELNGQLSTGVTSQNRELVDLNSSLLQNYADLANINAGLPNLLAELKQARVNMLENYRALLDLTSSMRENQSSMREREMNSGGDIQNQRRLNNIIAQIAVLENQASEFYIYALRGIVDRELSEFDAAAGEIDKALALLNTLDQTVRSPDDKERIAQMITAANNCRATALALKDVNQRNMADTVQRHTVRETTLTNAQKLDDIMIAMTSEVTANAVSSVSQVALSLIIGLLVAIGLSMLMAVIITRSITRPVNHAIDTLSEGAQEVDNASSQLSGASNTLAEGATENAASLEETSAALEELSSMTRRNADNSAEANALMAQATEAVSRAESSMSNVIRAMDEISVSGNEIGKIIKTIDEIAFQTNLLALNAAVEAARAGEAGAGFAVVADEVRNLAIRSADAAKNTADLIASTIANISSGSEMVNATAENFKTVESHSAKVAELLGEVAEASKEQSQGIGQITTAMTEMDKVTQSNAASAEESASAAGQLSLQAANLLEAVDELYSLVHGAGSHLTRRPAARPAAPSAPKAMPAPAARRGTTASNKSLPMDDDDFDF